MEVIMMVMTNIIMIPIVMIVIPIMVVKMGHPLDSRFLYTKDFGIAY